MKLHVNRIGRVAAGMAVTAAMVGAGVVLTAGTAAADALADGCTWAGNSGFSAKVVATAGQTISRQTIDASGCDVGIYIAAPHVTINDVTVTGANDAGILAMDTHHLTITRSDVHANGFNAPPAGPHGTPPEAGNLPQAFAISLFGVSDSTVTRNSVYDNGRGGIGVMDDGPNGPGRIVGSTGFPENPVPVANVTVSRNTLSKNYAGCGIVVSAFNVGNTVTGVTVTRNTIVGTGFAAAGADVGGIVAQSNGPASTVGNITISRNTVTNSVEGGIIVHAAAPGSKTDNVQVTSNTLTGNNLGAGETGQTTGVVVSTLGPAQNLRTVVSHNTMTDQFYGVWTHGPNAPTMVRNDITVTPGGSAYFAG